jgi:glycosyltransferase involved in cell wall biosynthesis
MAPYKIIFIVPARNEEKTIRSLIVKIKKFYKVLLINDNSSDLTAKIAKDAGAFVINNSSDNPGYQSAIFEGLIYAKKKKYDLAITCDADGQHRIKDALRLITLFSNDVDLLLTSRSNITRVSEKIFNFFYKVIWSIHDPLSGLKGYNLNKIKYTYLKNQKETLTTCLPIILRKNIRSYNFKEMEIYTIKRIDISRFDSGINFILLLISCFWNNLKIKG